MSVKFHFMSTFGFKTKKADLFCLSVILIFSLFISQHLFKGEFIAGHDYGGTLMKMLSMNLHWGHGQWVVRWVPELYGYGYPVFNFYPPLFYVLGSLIAKLGFDVIWSVNLVLFLVVFFSGITMYVLAREFWGRAGALICASAYLFAPYHIVDLYVRSAAAETAAFMFLPLLFWVFYKLWQTGAKGYFFLAGLACAGLILTHNGVSLIFLPFLFFYLCVLFSYSAHDRYLFLFKSSTACLLGLGLSSFYWLPALLEKRFVHSEVLTQAYADFHKNFLTFDQLVLPSWGYDLPIIGKEPQMSFQIGLIHWLLFFLVLLGFKKIVQARPDLKRLILFFCVCLGVGIFFTLPVSTFIWEHVNLLKFLQFPYRFLTIIVFFISLLAGSVVFIFPEKQRVKVAAGAVILILAFNYSYCHPRLTYKYDMSIVKSNPGLVLANLCQQDGMEYMPRWVQAVPQKVAPAVLGVVEGKADILESIQENPIKYSFKVQAASPSLFLFKSFYYPGWTIQLKGQAVEILKDNPYGLMFFALPAGIHDIQIFFGSTLLREWAKWISLISLSVLVLVFIFGRRKK